MHLLFGHDATVAEWTGDRLGARFPDAVGIGVIDDGGVLRAGLLLEMWNRFTAEFSVYAEPHSLTSDIAKAFFVHVFEGMGVARLQVHTDRSNKVVKRSAPKFGFVWDGVARNFYGPGQDGLRFYMTRDKCRWIKGTNGQNNGL